jgi:CubicO group peptidase (beta-lactamase class C family)
MVTHHVPGLSIAVGTDNELVWSQGYGIADLENLVPVTSASAFRTASAGKPMTSAAVLRLWQEQSLDLDAPVQRYCPGFPVKRWPVTARQLLAHVAGIRDKTPDEESNYTHYPSITAALSIFADDSLLFEPGTKYAYTSYGYDVLGCVIEGASGMPYADYMQRAVFAPAGMSSTRVDDARAIIPHRVRGYVLDDTGRLRTSISDDMSNRIPAGGFVSTSEDLVRFATSLLSGRLIADSTMKVMLQPPTLRTPRAPDDGAYALGWAVTDWYGVPEVWHGGGTPQASVFLYLLPSKAFVVAFMMNLEGAPDRGDLAGELAKIVLGDDAPRP